MGCNCKKAKQKQLQLIRSKKVAAGEVETVSLKVLKTRRAACKTCKQATKNPHPKFAMFGGLTSQSTCKSSKQKINECLKDPLYYCPEGHFDCES